MQLQNNLLELLQNVGRREPQRKPFGSFDVAFEQHVLSPLMSVTGHEICKAVPRFFFIRLAVYAEFTPIEERMFNRQPLDGVVVLIDFDASASHLQVPRNIVIDSERVSESHVIKAVQHDIATIKLPSHACLCYPYRNSGAQHMQHISRTRTTQWREVLIGHLAHSSPYCNLRLGMKLCKRTGDGPLKSSVDVAPDVGNVRCKRR